MTASGRCTPLRLGTSNHVPRMTLTSDPAPDTPLDNLKTTHRARRARWTDLSSGTITITGTLTGSAIGEYFAMPANNLTGAASVKLELYDSLTEPVDLLNMEPQKMGGLLPLGVWRAGIDPYNAIDERTKPNVLILWLGRAIKYMAFKLTIVHAATTGNVEMRMILLGGMLQLERNFAYGSRIKFLTPPVLVETASGGAVQVREQRVRRRLTLPLDQLSNADRQRLSDMEIGLRGEPFVVSAHPGREGWEYNQYNFLALWDDALEYTYFFEDIHEVNNMTLVEV